MRQLSIIVLFGLFVVAAWLRLDIEQSPATISTVIAPHHDVVAEQRAQMFKELSETQVVEKFILLSPDHYKLATGNVLTAKNEFSTRFGPVKVNTSIIDQLSNVPSESDVTFETEHGVKTILPDIAKYFPDSEVVPVVVKEAITEQQLEQTLEELYWACSDCVLIASADMSHYQPYLLSELHDDLTLRSINSLDRALLTEKAEVGPPHIVSAALWWAKRSGTEHFNQKFHTNSTELSGDYYEEGTTHIAGWFSSGEQVEPPAEATFTFVGDIMFDRGVRHAIDSTPEHLFSQLGDRVIWGTDIVMGNLEGPITDIPSLEEKYNNAPRFRFEPSSIEYLNYLHINTLNVDNNHVKDSGEDGFDDSLIRLQQAGINSVGAHNNPVIVEGEKLKLVVFSVDDTLGHTLEDDLLKQYADEDNNRIVIYTHWGVEEEREASTRQKNIAHNWIDLGADLVVGTGAHVIQPAEIYNGVPIVYSLGNFVFDMQNSTETSLGLILSGKFTNDAIILQPLISDGRNINSVLGRSDLFTDIVRQNFYDLAGYLDDERGGLSFRIE